MTRLAFFCAMLMASTALAQAPEPQPAPPLPAIPPPVDTPYPGVVTLKIDATDLDHRILVVTERLPVKSGPLTLLYPEWLPGEHAPDGRVDHLAGLTITANGQAVAWKRDPANVYAFHVDVPAGADALDLSFQILTPTSPNQGRISMSAEILDLEWCDTVLYPAGFFTRQINVAASLRLPSDWTLGTALESAGAASDVTSFKTVPLETLVDSPVFAGRYGKKVDLDPNGRSRVTLDLFADSPDLLVAKPEHIEAHRALVRQIDKLFGARHFDHYDMLLMLTERVGGIGLEHHRSSENGTRPTYFTEWATTPVGRDLVAHEFTHSWNGKFRRPFDLWTPNYNTPMRDSLLWMYEGQTEYWGIVLAARAGLLTRQQALDFLGLTAAAYNARVGRVWRNLQDTTNDPITEQRRPEPWLSWQRAEDYYNEGLLIWLDADTLIRELSKGKKSLDDFAHAFFGIEDGRWTPVTYTFDDIVAALNGVQPYDWATFLHERLDGHGPAPLDGLQRGGYRIAYTEKPSDYAHASETRAKTTDFTYSLGFTVGREGDLGSVLWNGPAFKARLAPGMHLIAVNGVTYDADRLKDAVKTGGAIDLLVKNGDHYKTMKIESEGGIRYPSLERIPGTPARLDDILTARK